MLDKDEIIFSIVSYFITKFKFEKIKKYFNGRYFEIDVFEHTIEVLEDGENFDDFLEIIEELLISCIIERKDNEDFYLNLNGKLIKVGFENDYFLINSVWIN